MATKDEIRLMLEVILKDKNFKKSLKGVETATAKSAKKQSNLIGGIKNSWLKIGIAIGTVSVVVKSIIKNTIAHEKAVAKLNNTLIKNGTATKAQVKDLLKYNNALQDTTGYSNDEIIAAQAMLGTFKLSAEQIKKLTPRLLDMNAATETATGTQQDLVTTATQLGKVFTGYESSLSRMGVTMTDVEKKNLKLADGMEKVNMVTKILDANFQGTAETVGQTFGGQLNILKGSVEDFQKTIGAILIPILTPIVKGFTVLAKVFTNLPGPIKAVTGAVAILGGALWALSAHPIIAGIALVATGVAFLTGKLKGAKGEAKDLNDELAKINTKQGFYSKALRKVEAKLKSLTDKHKMYILERKKEAELSKVEAKDLKDYLILTKRKEKIQKDINKAKKEEPRTKGGKKGGKEDPGGAAPPKAPITDYYTYVDDQRKLNRIKENDDYKEASAALDELYADKIGKKGERSIEELAKYEEYKLAKDEIDLMHKEEKAAIEAEQDALEEDRRLVSLVQYGKYYKDLTVIQKKSVNAMLKDWKMFEITKKELSETFVNSFLDGITSMKSSSKDVIVSMIKQFFGMVAGKLAALSALFFAQLNFPAGVAALAAAGAVKASGGSLAGLVAGYEEGGKVPKVAYAAAGMAPRGTDTVPAMLTPGERVLSVAQTNAFEGLMKSIALPGAGGSSNVSNVTNEGDTVVNNEFNNNFEGNAVDEMLEFSQNVGVDLLRR